MFTIKKLFPALVMLCFALACTSVQENRDIPVVIDGDSADPVYQRGVLLYKDDFDSGLANWIIETPASPNSLISIINKKLVIDVDGGATVWLNQKLAGNILIEYKRKVIMDGGRNDRLSDMNQFWMATDPKNPNLFTRTGVFTEYDFLSMYYVGVGGNTNSTTRFRKYTGTGDRVLHGDLQDQEHLLEPNKEYKLTTIVYNGVTRFLVDDKEYFSFRDPEPLLEGFFGFRTTQSRHEIDDLEIYALE